MCPVRARNSRALDHHLQRRRRRRCVRGNVRVQGNQVLECLGLVTPEAEHLSHHEQRTAAGLQGVGQDDLLLPHRVEQVVPGGQSPVVELLRKAVAIGHDAEHTGVPTRPVPGRILETRIDRLGRRGAIRLEHPFGTERIVELARAADEHIGEGRCGLGTQLCLEGAGRTAQQVDRHTGIRGRERSEELRVGGFVQGRIHREVAGYRRCGGRRRGRIGDEGAST
ncbi:unannotated protein [freshwater metagenome]|uniref:Unannotated protein n=1 Tax=freshwater metagenome TaxID=449393 RepID=A0A6J6QHU6_9ZZZZ